MQYTYYISSPLIDGSHYGSKQFASPMKELNEQTILVEDSAVNKNDSYRQKTKYNDQVDCYYSSYDLGALIGNKESYLEGKLDSNDDTDYYSFSYAQKNFYNKMGVSTEITIRLENIPEGCDYNLTVYDMYGNQIGMAKDIGDGCKELILPDWDSSVNRYVIKVENGNGQQVSSEAAYRIKISETKGATNTETDTKTAESGLSYDEQVQKLHEEQYNALPENEKYNGTETVEELLEKMASGEALSTQEISYLKIFANLSDYEKAEASGKIKNVLYPQIQEELEKAGIDVSNKKWSIELDADGNISVSGELEEEEKKTITQVLEDKFADKLWDYYMQVADLTTDNYNRINGYRELSEFLKKATNGAYTWKDIAVDENGKISGLPAKMCQLLNSQECNGKYEQLRDIIYSLNDYRNWNGMSGITDFKVKYQIFGADIDIAA